MAQRPARPWQERAGGHGADIGAAEQGRSGGHSAEAGASEQAHVGVEDAGMGYRRGSTRVWRSSAAVAGNLATWHVHALVDDQRPALPPVRCPSLHPTPRHRPRGAPPRPTPSVTHAPVLPGRRHAPRALLLRQRLRGSPPWPAPGACAPPLPGLCPCRRLASPPEPACHPSLAGARALPWPTPRSSEEAAASWIRRGRSLPARSEEVMGGRAGSPLRRPIFAFGTLLRDDLYNNGNRKDSLTGHTYLTSSVEDDLRKESLVNNSSTVPMVGTIPIGGTRYRKSR
ncbi:hypothetical protein U9M48_005180 [Paspalum notatum var. saurae]|uniref:Uncharacterized protein n=1 Tax=Paspalum notatum var. saurae TaxID=547442 RepID=A0AAQ3PLS2_PASNO